MSDINVTVTLTTRTCERGHLWATVHWMGSGKCPHCGSAQISELIGEKNELSLTVTRLRGYLKSLRKKKGKA